MINAKRHNVYCIIYALLLTTIYGKRYIILLKAQWTNFELTVHWFMILFTEEENPIKTCFTEMSQATTDKRPK